MPRPNGGATAGRPPAAVVADAEPAAPVQPPVAAPQMKAGPRIAIGVYLGLMSAIVLAHLLWVWSFTARLVPGTAGASHRHVRVHWLGLAFTPTVEWALVLLVVFAAAAASLAHLSLVFSNRYGLGTLQPAWTWWYLLRPGAAAIVGVVAYVVLKAGFLGTVTDQDQHSLAFAAAVGALAGMFTDALIAKLRAAMGASPFEQATAGTDPTDATVAAESNKDAAPQPKHDNE